MDLSINEALAKAKTQASRLLVIINARKLTMSDLESSSLDVESGCRSTNTASTSTSRRRHSRPFWSRST